MLKFILWQFPSSHSYKLQSCLLSNIHPNAYTTIITYSDRLQPNEEIWHENKCHDDNKSDFEITV